MSRGLTAVDRARQVADHFFRIHAFLEAGEPVVISEWMVETGKAPTIHNFRVADQNDFDCMMRRYSYKEYFSSCISLVLGGVHFAWVWKNMKHCSQFRNRFIQVYGDEDTYDDDEESEDEDSEDEDGDDEESDDEEMDNDVVLKVHFVVLESCLLVLDKMGSKLSNTYVSTRCEMETALSWLSTLGGAFSALGDISFNYAVEAAQVSMKQLRIAWKLNDPLIGSRCRLYMAISLMQRGSLREARLIVKKEHRYALSLPEGVDTRLRRMCLGVWAKLQYAWTMRQKRKALTSSLQTGSNCLTKNFAGGDPNAGQKQSNMSNGSLES